MTPLRLARPLAGWHNVISRQHTQENYQLVHGQRFTKWYLAIHTPL